MVRVSETSQTAAERGEAELRTLDFKTSWSELQKPSQTAAGRGEAELRTLDFKTTWSELQKPSQTSCIYSILKPHGQSSKSPVRLLTHNAMPS